MIPPTSSRFGFSLIETTLAIGLVAFVMTGLAGLIPVALDSLREARNAVVISELARTHLAEAARSDFSTLDALAGSRWYDATGNGVARTAPSAFYQVVNRVAANNGGVARVHVAIYLHPQSEAGAARPLDEFVSIIANNGR